MTAPAHTSTLFPAVRNQLATIRQWAEKVPEERRKEWRKLVRYIRNKQSEQRPVQVVFVCTHNSRRSIFGQVWASVMADHFGLDHFTAYSAGTEATAVAPAVLEYFAAQQMEVRRSGDTTKLHYAEAKAPMPLFSKTLDDPSLPKEHFVAVMVCDHADANCPFVPGADLRLSIWYKDPKSSDGKPNQADAYKATSLQVASELYYTFNLL